MSNVEHSILKGEHGEWEMIVTDFSEAQFWFFSFILPTHFDITYYFDCPTQFVYVFERLHTEG